MPVYNNILETIGNTPIVRINKLANHVKASLFVKIEARNPGGSVKDRIGVAMIEAAEKEGILKPGMKIVEPTSGNTGIGLALACAVKGYKITLTMPESMSIERRKILKAYGADIVLTPAQEGMNGAVKKAEEMAKTDKMIFIPQQFKNKANPEIHRKTTALEIWKDMEQKIDVFVAGIGTGGTITGIGETLKSFNPKCKIIAVEPKDSPLLSEGRTGPHKIQGIGPNFKPDILNDKVYDEIYAITTDEAFSASRSLAQNEGIFVGISAGAAFAAALKYAEKTMKKERILAFLPDTGERYVSTDLWNI